MGRKRQFISIDEAVSAKGQHTQACSDCPWARTAIPGWLGSNTAEEWLKQAHGEAQIDCHVLIGAQCAGAAIYRANTAKICRSANILRLPRDREKVFANPMEFMQHHKRRNGSEETEQSTEGGFTGND